MKKSVKKIEYKILMSYINADSLSDVCLLVAEPDEMMDFPQKSVSLFGKK